MGEDTFEDKALLGDTKRGAKTAYHGGFSYLERIDALLKMLDSVVIPEETQEGDAVLCGLTPLRHNQRLALLTSLFHELAPKMSAQQKDNHTKAQIYATSLFSIARQQIADKNRVIDTRFIAFFNKWELQLRYIVEEKGLLMPMGKTGLDATGE